METYNLRLPNGEIIARELEKDEVEYWLSIGMYLAHGFQLMTTVFALEQSALHGDDEEIEDSGDVIELSDKPVMQ